MDARIEAFLQYIKYEKNYSELTVKNYRMDLCQYETFVVALRCSFEPSKEDLNLARAWMADMAQRRLNVATVKRRLCAVRSFYKYLQQRHGLASNPLDLLSAPKVPKSLPVWVREEQMEHLLDDVDYGEGFEAVRDRLVIDLLYSTGMRRAEAASLKDGDIDFGNHTVRVVGKGNRQRLIPFGFELETLMRNYMNVRSSKFGERTETFLVTSEGAPLGVSRLAGIAKKYLGHLPTLAKKSTHVLRHTFATNMLNSGADLMAVKALLGHRTLQSTEVYTHITPQEIIASYNQAHPRAIIDKNTKKKGD